MRVDFYQLSQDPAPAAAAMLARKSREAEMRVLIVAADPAQREAISRALWEAAPEAFLAHGMAGGPHDERQPILLAEAVINRNGAEYLLLADGQWRDPGAGFERVMLLFDEQTRDGARAAWRDLGHAEGVERRYWRQDGGRWIEGP
jgi:DNA polymerase-3 subunit chi